MPLRWRTESSTTRTRARRPTASCSLPSTPSCSTKSPADVTTIFRCAATTSTSRASSWRPSASRAGTDGLAELAALVKPPAAIARRRQDLRPHEERTHHRRPEDEVGNRDRGIVHASRYRNAGGPSLVAEAVGRLFLP